MQVLQEVLSPLIMRGIVFNTFQCMLVVQVLRGTVLMSGYMCIWLFSIGLWLCLDFGADVTMPTPAADVRQRERKMAAETE